MHKAPLTALAANLAANLAEDGLRDVEIRICDLQTRGHEQTYYGNLDFGSGVLLEKYRVGAQFAEADGDIRESTIIGINANYTHSRRIVSDFLAHARRVNPKVLAVVGGTDATGDPDYFLKAGADVVVRGEGELSFRQLITSYMAGAGFELVSNVHYRDPDGGAIIANPSTFLNLQTAYNVEQLPPPALDLIDLSVCSDTGEGRPPYRITGPFISVETSRGCAQSCSFCATPVTKGRFRFMTFKAIRAHFQFFYEHGVRTLLFQEDNILSRLHRGKDGSYVRSEGRRAVLDIFNLAYDMGFNWEFTNGVEFGQLEHAGHIDYELINTMFRHEMKSDNLVGCYRATMPLENLTDQSSRLFRKLKPLGIIKDICQAVVASGVAALSFNLIIGRPDDDEHNLALSYQRCLELREVCKSINPSIQIYFNVYVLSLLPGTVDYRNFKHMIAFDLDRDPEVITFYLGSLQTQHFTPLEITQARGTLASLLNADGLIEDYDETRFLTSPRFEKLFCGA
jgi:radical SAM superfamily enzyme YgiQ (UPF0313 family)